MEKKKKKWEKPELIVISRGRIEENILGTCPPAEETGGTPMSGQNIS